MYYYVAKQIVGFRAYAACSIATIGILNARVVGALGAVIEVVGNSFNLTENTIALAIASVTLSC